MPGHERAVGVRAEPPAVFQEVVEPRLGEEPLRREDRVQRHRPVPLAQDEPVAILGFGSRGVDTQHPVVQHPERVERAGRALLVLLVARRSRHERSHVREPVGRGIHRAYDRSSSALEVKRCEGASATRRPASDRRGGFTQRSRHLGDPLLRGRGLDLSRAVGIRPAPVRPTYAATAGVHQSCTAGRTLSRRGRRVAAHAASSTVPRPRRSGHGCRELGGGAWTSASATSSVCATTSPAASGADVSRSRRAASTTPTTPRARTARARGSFSATIRISSSSRLDDRGIEPASARHEPSSAPPSPASPASPASPEPSASAPLPVTSKFSSSWTSTTEPSSSSTPTS